jgi:hypothetical protein
MYQDKWKAPAPRRDAEPETLECRYNSLHTPEPDPKQIDADLAAARVHLEQRAEVFEKLSRWKECLQERIWRSQQRFELCDVDHFDPELEHEIADFTKIAKIYRWTGRGR